MFVLTITRWTIFVHTIFSLTWWRRWLFFDFFKKSKASRMNFLLYLLVWSFYHPSAFPKARFNEAVRAPIFLFYMCANGKPLLRHDERKVSRNRLNPRFSANLSYALIFLALQYHSLGTNRELDLLLQVKAKNRTTVGLLSYFNPIWRGGTRRTLGYSCAKENSDGDSPILTAMII